MDVQQFNLAVANEALITGLLGENSCIYFEHKDRPGSFLDLTQCDVFIYFKLHPNDPDSASVQKFSTVDNTIAVVGPNNQYAKIFITIANPLLAFKVFVKPKVSGIAFLSYFGKVKSKDLGKPEIVNTIAATSEFEVNPTIVSIPLNGVFNPLKGIIVTDEGTVIETDDQLNTLKL